MSPLRFAVLGTGFWAKYQIPAWLQLPGVELVALYNRTISKAEALAHTYGIPRVYDSPEKLLREERLDYIDIITDVDTHEQMTALGAQHGVHVICQKPMAPKLDAAKRMVDVCRQHSVKLFIHENWRWQRPVRKVKELLLSGVIGEPFKGQVTFCSAFPVFDNQPFLATLDEFILTDIGSHILDVCRFLFGEVAFLTAHNARVNPSIKGEDVANVMMKMNSGLTCYAEMSYASLLEREAFPQTFIQIEGTKGSIKLSFDFWISITTRDGTQKLQAKPPEYAWADPAYALVHASIVDCNKDLLADLRGERQAETTGSDNLETVRLIHAAYASDRSNRTIAISEFA